MASKVDHRKVRSMIEDRKSTIRDEELFTSRLMCAHFEDINTASTKVYNISRDVRVSLLWKEGDSFVACTDNQTVFINTAHTFGLKSCPRKTRYAITQGKNGHELGHILFTDFPAQQSFFNLLTRHIWYPSAPPADTAEEAEAVSEIFEYASADPKNERAIFKIMADINNIIEDGYIEERMLRYFPGSIGQGLKFVRHLHYEDMPALSDMIAGEEKGAPTISTLLQLLLSYVKFGKLKYGDAALTDERVQIIFDLLPVLDQAVQSGDVKDRFAATNIVLLKFWKYVKEFIENLKADPEPSENDGSSGESPAAESEEDDNPAGKHSHIEKDFDSALTEMLDSLIGKSKEAKGSTAPIAGLGAPSGESESEEARAETASLAGITPPDASDEESGGSEDSPPDIPGAMTSDSDDERLDLGTIYDDDYEGFAEDRVSDDLDRLLEGIAERDTMRALEEMRTSELEAEANSLGYADIHAGISVVVHRMASVPDGVKSDYDKTAPPLLRISKLLQKSILQQLKDVQLGGKRTGLLMGRRLDVHALPRNDGKCFYKNSLPQDAPQLAVALLLDESGSMWSSNRALFARYTAIVIYDFCRSLGIPVTVYGHSTTRSHKYGHTLDLYSYAEFESINDDDKYRMMDITARSNNRDGMALKYVAEKLVKRPEQERILILVSDGQPADDDYYGPEADEDLHKTVREYTRKGILFIAAAIGSDKDEIERIYGNAFMDISDLNTLPEKLTGVIKRHIRI